MSLEQEHRPDALADFRVQTTLWVSVAGVLLLTPFGMNNMLRGRLLLGSGAVVIVVILAVLAWLASKGRLSNLSLLLLPPVLAFLVLSIRDQGIIGVLWCYPGIVCFYFIFQERWAWLANAIVMVTVVPLAAAELEIAVAIRAMVTLTLMSVFSIMAVRVIAIQQQRLSVMAVTDSLTGLLNRSLLTPSLEQAFSHHRRTQEPAALLTIDVDHFKNINDSLGHKAGDDVLIGVAKLLRRRLRATDQIFRIGGEEFAILLPDTAAGPGLHVGQLLRSAVAGETLAPGHPLTISVGVAQLLPGDTSESWLARADRCLYEAKRKGRNCVVADSPDETDSIRPGETQAQIAPPDPTPGDPSPGEPTRS